MSIRIRYFSPVAILIVALLFLTGSSRVFIAKPIGNFGEAITFSFYKILEDENPTQFNITEFVIQEQKGKGEWITIWELKGKQALNAITYGKKYKNLIEAFPAKPLSRTAKYRALISEQAWFHPVGYSTMYFAFSESGAVVLVGQK